MSENVRKTAPKKVVFYATTFHLIKPYSHFDTVGDRILKQY